MQKQNDFSSYKDIKWIHKNQPSKKGRIIPFFFISFSFALFIPQFFPAFKGLFFAPFLIIVYLSRSFEYSLTIAILCGFITDCLGGDLPFGTSSLNYVLTTLLLFRYRIYFVKKPSGIGTLTFLFSFLSTSIQGVMFVFWKNAPHPTAKGLLSDLLFFPFFDALYGLSFFAFPPICFQFFTKKSRTFLFLLKNFKRKKREYKEIK